MAKSDNIGLNVIPASEVQKTFIDFRDELAGDGNNSNMIIIDKEIGNLKSKVNELSQGGSSIAINNTVTSTSSTEALSAAMGKWLNDNKLSKNDTAAAAEKLESGKNLQVDLESNSFSIFDGSSHANNIGVRNNLSVHNGGTGGSTSQEARENLEVEMEIRKADTKDLIDFYDYIPIVDNDDDGKTKLVLFDKFREFLDGAYGGSGDARFVKSDNGIRMEYDHPDGEIYWFEVGEDGIKSYPRMSGGSGELEGFISENNYRSMSLQYDNRHYMASADPWSVSLSAYGGDPSGYSARSFVNVTDEYISIAHAPEGTVDIESNIYISNGRVEINAPNGFYVNGSRIDGIANAILDITG